MSKYIGQTALGLVGMVCVASPLIFKLPAQFRTFDAASQIEQSEAIERSRIAQRRQTADALAQAGVMPNGQKLKIRHYYENPKKDPAPETSGWLADETVYVYDSANQCIGKIQNRKWYWIQYYETICKDTPAM